MSQRRTLALTAQQRDEPVYHRDHDPKPYARERAAALLKIADGASPHAVACSGLLRRRDPGTVYAWLGRYQAEGLPALFGRPHGGYRRGRL